MLKRKRTFRYVRILFRARSEYSGNWRLQLSMIAWGEKKEEKEVDLGREIISIYICKM